MTNTPYTTNSVDEITVLLCSPFDLSYRIRTQDTSVYFDFFPADKASETFSRYHSGKFPAQANTILETRRALITVMKTRNFNTDGMFEKKLIKDGE